MLARAPWPWDWSPEAWTAVAAWTTATVAALAALFARRQVQEVRKTREEQAQPFIVVDFEPSEVSSKLMNLVIRNSGQTLAKKVTITFNPPLQTTLSKHGAGFSLADSWLITGGIPAMPPRREYSMLFEDMTDRYTSDLPRKYSVSVAYTDSRDRPYSLTYPLDLGIYYGAGQVEAYGLHHAAKALRDIRDQTKKWTQHHDGIRVWVRDEDKHLAEQREDFERWKKGEQEKQDAITTRSPGDPDPDDPQIRN